MSAPPVPTLHPEERLLLSLIRPGGTDDVATLVTSLDSARWARFEALLEQHALLPLAFGRLANYARSVPEALFADLRRKVQLNIGFSYRLAKLLLELVELLDAHDLPAVPFKGPSLAVSAYGDLTLRPFSDLDIFVYEGSVNSARALLKDRGFAQVHEASPEQRLAYHLTMIDAAENVVELHWEIAPRFFASAVRSGGAWQRTRYVTVLGTPLPCFGPEDQLLLLCVHGSKHLWERLGWICDVAMILRREAVDWPELLGRAQRLGTERMLLLGVRLAHDLLEAPLPANVLARSRSVALEVLACGVYRHLFPRPGATALSVPRFYLKLQTRPDNWLRLISHLLRDKLS